MMQQTNETHIATAQEKPIRLQEYGVGIFPTLATKSALKKALKKNLILVNGQQASTATFINGNETITFQKPLIKKSSKTLVLPLEVVFEDDYLAVIHKPAGIQVSGNSFKTIDNALVQNLKPSLQIDAVRPRPVHRLDYATTGLLLVGKTSSSILDLNTLFENKTIAKTYFAVAIGAIKKEGILNFEVDEKEAVSHFEVIETAVSERFKYLNLVQLSPKTGRRHQLRKHLSALGNPILGDAVYGQEGLILKGKGLYLHAFSLAFKHPATNQNMYFEKKIPKRFLKIFKKSRS